MTVSRKGYLKSHHSLKQEATPSIRWGSSLKELNIYKIKLPKNMKVEEAIKIYNQSGFVEYAEPDYIMKIQNKKKKELKIYYDIGLC